MSHEDVVDAAVEAFDKCEAYWPGKYSIEEVIQAYLSASNQVLVPRGQAEALHKVYVRWSDGCPFDEDSSEDCELATNIGYIPPQE